MYTLTTPPTYLWSVHLPSTQQHQGLYWYKMSTVNIPSTQHYNDMSIIKDLLTSLIYQQESTGWLCMMRWKSLAWKTWLRMNILKACKLAKSVINILCPLYMYQYTKQVTHTLVLLHTVAVFTMWYWYVPVSDRITLSITLELTNYSNVACKCFPVRPQLHVYFSVAAIRASFPIIHSWLSLHQ